MYSALFKNNRKGLAALKAAPEMKNWQQRKDT
jgi:hypothetical protein